ncbi:uncharacterized protein LOC129729376 [Wyeomyia smithii]|uniref:uncharacterized protein LOC129729376 n=1 Tax=Wyeomyia smithii TaxID=174621 RepID=UPI0024681FDF|nr:uncharacterized protein LOC129729376 [Wyeomyia smithii]
MNVADPWSSNSNTSSSEISQRDDSDSPFLKFEDNFEPPKAPEQNIQQPQEGRLPDSDNYLAVLERKLKRLKTNPSVLQQLAERREVCMQHLLNDSAFGRSDPSDLELLELEEPVNNYELLRFIKPEQALSVAELVNLVKYDHLESDPANLREHEDVASSKEGEESGTESSTSR